MIILLNHLYLVILVRIAFRLLSFTILASLFFVLSYLFA